MRTRRAFAAALVALGLSAAPAGAATGNIFTVAGNGTAGFSGDEGPATQAQLSGPTAMLPAGGGFYIADQSNRRVRVVGSDGTITTVAGSGALGAADGPALSASFSGALNGMAQLPDGSLLVTDANNNIVRKIGIDGNVTRVAGAADLGSGYNGDNIPADSARLSFPTDVAVLPDGSWLIADQDNNRIRRVENGTITTVVSGVQGPSGLSVTADGGYLVAERDAARISKGFVGQGPSVVAGTGSAGYSGDGGPAVDAQINIPTDVAATPDGGYVIADLADQRVRRVSPGGTITTLAGTGTGGYNGDDIPTATAQLNNPISVAANTDGDVFIADAANHRIRFVDIGDPPAPPPPPVDNPSSITLDAENVGNRRPGTPLTVAGTVLLQSGAPAANRQIRYAITGANADAGVLTTDANGVARHTWDGLRDGTDTIVMYADLNSNGLQDAGEPFDRASVTWVLPVPVIAKRANIEPVSGRVLIKLPVSSSSKRDPDLVAAQSKFIPLEEARSIPFGSIIDTRRGVAEITSAATSRSQQSAQFYNGNFELRQDRGTRPYTEVRMNETLSCPRSSSKQVAPARARSRQLWGNGRGRFRTRGRYSSASVRGTIWWSKDDCKKTTTVVRQGTVVVRDFGKKKNVTLKAPARYVAKKPKPKKRR